MFLWGTEDLLLVDKHRSQFKGVLNFNKETGRQKMVAKSAWVQRAKKAAGFLAVVLMIILTILSATGAMV